MIWKYIQVGIFMSILSTFIFCGYAQDTVRINLHEAEQLFLKKNLQLIAEKYNIETAKAERVQAALFDNPVFSGSVDIYNPDNKKWFDVNDNSGQYVLSVEQLIRLGGKRGKAINLANIGIRLSENQYYDLMRNLRFSLTSVFYDTYYAFRSLKAFDNQLSLLEELQKSSDELQKRGIISFSEAVRIQSLLYSIQSDRLELQKEFNEKQSQLQLLLQNNSVTFIPEIQSTDYAFRNPDNYSLTELIDQTLVNRIDLQSAKDELIYEKADLSLQKAMAIPDVTVGVEFDKRGNFTENLFSLTLSADLPLFNRNQGNIRASKAAVKQKEVLLEQKQSEVINEVQKVYLNALNAEKLSHSIHPEFEANLNKVLQGITENFKKRNISLPEFTDFCESYRDNIIKLNEIRNQKAQTMEELRFVTGGEVKNTYP
jgi:cobalt-zinc-cadmium efflux system outer membrane protein